MNRILCINALAFPERVDTNDEIVLNKWTHYFEFRFFCVIFVCRICDYDRQIVCKIHVVNFHY